MFLSHIPALAIFVLFYIFVIWVLWMIVKSLKSIDVSLREIARNGSTRSGSEVV